MPKLKYQVKLTEEEVIQLRGIVQKGNKHSAKTIMHANVLLNTNDLNSKKKTDREIAEFFNISKTTVNQIRRTYATSGMESALYRKTRLTPPIMSKITGDFEAHVIAKALSPAPSGRARWTLRLLAEHCVDDKYLIEVSHTGIAQMLNTNEVKPHLSKYWCIPKTNDASFVAHMEDVLSIYQLPYNPLVPVICMDEKPIQLLDEVRSRITAKPLRTNPDTDLPIPGISEKIDSEYVRCGHGSIFIFTEPLVGWRYVEARQTRTKRDFALLMYQIRRDRYPHAHKIILVADNLNTHSKVAFYETFPPHLAFELSQAYEFHYTPVHGSWLNIAECELSGLTRECLAKKRISSLELLNEHLHDWQKDKNMRQRGVNWQFTAEDARVKLKRLYPTPAFSVDDLSL
jgi:hypothetical protein